MNQYLGLIFFGVASSIILLLSLYDDWKKYRFNPFSRNRLEEAPIKAINKPIINKKTIKFQNKVIQASIRTKI